MYKKYRNKPNVKETILTKMYNVRRDPKVYYRVYVATQRRTKEEQGGRIGRWFSTAVWES